MSTFHLILSFIWVITALSFIIALVQNHFSIRGLLKEWLTTFIVLSIVIISVGVIISPIFFLT